jgi:hypothetical protein
LRNSRGGTLRQTQLVLNGLHEEISGQAVPRKTLHAYCGEWLAAKVPETAPRTAVFYRTSTAKFITFLGERAEAPLERDNQGRHRCLSQLFGQEALGQEYKS